MSLITPTTKEISDNIIAQLEASLNQTIPLLPKSFMRVLAKALAGVFILLYKFGGFIFLQMFVSSASAKETIVNGKTLIPLVEWGRLIGVGDPVAATNAELLIDIIVEVQTGSLSSGTQLLNVDNGVTYITLGAILLNSATVQVTVRAVSDQVDGGGAGVIGNLDPGAVLSFANPLANVARDTTVVSQTVTAANAEATEVYRQRVIDRFQNRPQGGALADYRQDGEEVAGIINIYPYTSECPGQVDVFAEATVASSGNPDGIPTAAQLQAVLDSIEFDENGLATRRPAGALVNAFPITRTAFDVRVLGLSVPDGGLAAVQADTTAAVTEFFLSREPFIVGLSIGNRTDQITQTALGGVIDDIVSAAGGIFTGVTLELNTVVISLHILGIGEKSKLGTISYV